MLSGPAALPVCSDGFADFRLEGVVECMRVGLFDGDNVVFSVVAKNWAIVSTLSCSSLLMGQQQVRMGCY